MPHEGYITKKNINDYKSPSQDQDIIGNNQMQNKQQSEEWKAYNKLQTESTSLISNKRTSFTGKEKEDSAHMNRVKTALNNITNFYTDTSLPASQKEFDKQLSQLQEMYKDLKKQCDAYLETRASFWKNIIKGEGYRRYKMVNEARTKASVEMAILANRAKAVFEEFSDVKEEDDRPLWVNVLAEARTTHLDLSTKNKAYKIGRTQGCCNSVIKLTSNKNRDVAYIKEDSINTHPRQCANTFLERLYKTELWQKCDQRKVQKDEIENFIKVMCHIFSVPNTDIDDIFWKGKRQTRYIAKNMKDLKVLDRVIFFAEEIAKNERIGKQFEDAKKTANTDYGKAILGEFAEYYHLHITSHLIANDNVKMDENSSITNRNIATYRLAELLGVPELIPNSRKVKYKDDNGNDCEGILMAEAKGMELFESYEKVNKETYKYSDQIYFQMNALQILDVIAGQTDRNNTNIYVELVGGQFKNLKGIDNDMSFGKLSYKDIQKREHQNYLLRTLEDKNGLCTVKLIDKRLYDSLMALTDEMVTYVFADLLTKDELAALLDRIKGVKALLERTYKKDSNIFKYPDDENLHDAVQGAVTSQSSTLNYLTKQGIHNLYKN